MARPCKPIGLHVIEGTYRRDRHRAPSPSWLAEPLGAPPADWLPLAKPLWNEIPAQVPCGVATKHDRVVFELLIRLLARARETPAALSPALAAQIRACAGAFGMSSADRAKLSAPPPDDPAFTSQPRD